MAKRIEKIINTAIAVGVSALISTNLISINGCAGANYQIIENNNAQKILEKRQNITRGNKKFREIALTFDYEAGKKEAEFILDALKKENVKATFFITGDMIERHPDIVRRIVDEGHEAGNHTYDHRKLTLIKRLDENIVKEELSKTDKLFYKITGKNLIYWRARAGAVNKKILEYAAKNGYGPHIYWTIDPRDWECREGMQEMTEKRLFSLLQKDKYNGNGAIIVEHASSTSKFYKKLPEIIQRLKKNYSLVTLSEIIDDKDDFSYKQDHCKK